MSWSSLGIVFVVDLIYTTDELDVRVFVFEIVIVQSGNKRYFHSYFDIRIYIRLAGVQFARLVWMCMCVYQRTISENSSFGLLVPFLACKIKKVFEDVPV